MIDPVSFLVGVVLGVLLLGAAIRLRACAAAWHRSERLREKLTERAREDTLIELHVRRRAETARLVSRRLA